jgi:beta-barrel assembly-enhancing protease
MKKTFLQILLLVALFFGMWFTLGRVPWLRLFKIEQVSKKTEEKLGDLLWEAFSAKHHEVHSKKIVGPVDSILTRICEANHIDREDIKLHVLSSEEVNAFALPDKHLVVYTRLIADCHSEEELSGVMGHELAHIQLNHVMKKLVKEIGLAAVIAITTGNRSAEIISEAARMLSSTAYDRRLESQADLKAVDYLIKADINPEPFADFLYRLANDDEDDTNLTWISTHPESKERAETIIDYQKGKRQEHLPILAEETWDKLREDAAE